MVARSVQAVLEALNAAEVRYLVAGGLAVVAHGYLRGTVDIDLVVALDEANALRAVRGLARLGYRPLVPVPIESFANSQERERWMRDKHAKVFQLFSDEHPTTRVDLLLKVPFDFEAAFARAFWGEPSAGVNVPFVGFDDLVAMKEAAGRPQDLVDVEKLRLLRRHRDVDR